MRALAATTNDRGVVTRQRTLMVLVYLAAIVVAATVSAQRPKAQDPKLKPRPVTLKTKDGLQLRAFYFPSDRGKEAITVMLVHEWLGQASPYGPLVIALRDAGCAVLVPDYRGHGGSKEYINNRGEKTTFNMSQMSKRDVENIITLDLEKAKSFLKDENNEERLNLNAMVVIGVREGCVMAAHWAQRDWSWPSVGRLKQGQDVKALVFISPEKQIKGIGIDLTLKDTNLLSLPMMIVAGEKSDEADEAKRIGKRVQSTKRRMGKGETSGFKLEMVNTTLSGPALVGEKSKLIPAIVKFVTSSVKIGDGVNEWVDRD